MSLVCQCRWTEGSSLSDNPREAPGRRLKTQFFGRVVGQAFLARQLDFTLSSAAPGFVISSEPERKRSQSPPRVFQRGGINARRFA
jgi:hypothetical protein